MLVVSKASVHEIPMICGWRGEKHVAVHECAVFCGCLALIFLQTEGTFH